MQTVRHDLRDGYDLIEQFWFSGARKQHGRWRKTAHWNASAPYRCARDLSLCSLHGIGREDGSKSRSRVYECCGGSRPAPLVTNRQGRRESSTCRWAETTLKYVGRRHCAQGSPMAVPHRSMAAADSSVGRPQPRGVASAATRPAANGLPPYKPWRRCGIIQTRMQQDRRSLDWCLHVGTSTAHVTG